MRTEARPSRDGCRERPGSVTPTGGPGASLPRVSRPRVRGPHNSVNRRRFRRFFRGAPTVAALALLASLPAPSATAGSAGTAPFQPIVELRPAGKTTPAPTPSRGAHPIQLVLDDGTQDATFGATDGAGAQQFLWFQRFASPGPFDLREVHVLFPGGVGIVPGAAVQLAVFHDPNGDPTDGADLLATLDATIQAADDGTFSVYPLAPAVGVPAGGDVLIGVVNRFVTSGVSPPSSPASLDTTAPQGRSWFAIWTGDPPDPPQLPADVLTTQIDPFLAGNWMIRGFGTESAAVEIPTLGGAGLALLAALLTLAATGCLRRARGAPVRVETGRLPLGGRDEGGRT